MKNIEKPDLKIIFQKLNQLSDKIEKNTNIVKDLRSHNRWSFFFKILYYSFLVAMAFGAWYVIQPVIDSFTSTVNDFKETGNNINNTFNDLKGAGDSAKSFLDKFKN